jgi:hypothetical protein
MSLEGRLDNLTGPEEVWLDIYEKVGRKPAFAIIKMEMELKEGPITNDNLRNIKSMLIDLKNQLSGSDRKLCESMLFTLQFI